MQHLLRLDDWSVADVEAVWSLADEYSTGRGPRIDGAAVMFLPASSLRTRVSFERGAALMGLQPIVFSPDVLDRPEAPEDVAGYLASWADVLVVRHSSITVLEDLARTNVVPVINAMTDINHPCEVLADLYSLTVDHDLGTLRALRLLFVGADGNIARAWQEAARLLGLQLVQCCPLELAAPGAVCTDDLWTAVTEADVIVTDAPGVHERELAPFRITAEVLAAAPRGVRLAPCPPFLRGREVSADALASSAFVGHGFKRALLPVQQAVLAHCIGTHQR